MDLNGFKIPKVYFAFKVSMIDKRYTNLDQSFKTYFPYKTTPFPSFQTKVVSIDQISPGVDLRYFIYKCFNSLF